MKSHRFLSALLAAALLMTLILTGCNNTGGASSSLGGAAPSSSRASSSSSRPNSSSSLPSSSGLVSSSKASTAPTMSTDFNEIGALDNTPQGWGQGVRLLEDNRPEASVYFQELYGGYNAKFIGENNTNIYLTFDQGYENGYTPAILDTLKEKGVSAVFFVTYDYAKGNPELMQRMIDEGHIIGNHSYAHKNYPSLSPEDAFKDLNDMHNYVKDTYGYEMYLFRPPEGVYSEQMLALIQQTGYQTVFWSFAYKDWVVDDQMGYDAAYEKVSSHAHNGAIYLLHAVSKDNCDILGAVIDDFRAKGFTLAAYDLQ